MRPDECILASANFAGLHGARRPVQPQVARATGAGEQAQRGRLGWGLALDALQQQRSYVGGVAGHAAA